SRNALSPFCDLQLRPPRAVIVNCCASRNRDDKADLVCVMRIKLDSGAGYTFRNEEKCVRSWRDDGVNSTLLCFDGAGSLARPFNPLSNLKREVQHYRPLSREIILD